jgi:septin family protein
MERSAYPSMSSLREIDIELMRRLSPRVNVIPVIGKADSLTPTELKTFKKRVSRLASTGSVELIHSRTDHGGH